MNIPDARIWFRFRCKITSHIKGNVSSMYKDNMKCKCCKSGADETQEYLEECDFTKDMRISLDLQKEKDRSTLWRRISRALRYLYKMEK